MDFAPHQIHKTGNNNYLVTHGSDQELYAEFETIAVLQTALSEQEGREIWKDIPHIKIMFPGDKNKLICRPVRMQGDMNSPSDPERFPRQWAAYLAKQEQTAEGTPLVEWPMIGRAQALEFKSLHIHTVEALASVPDNRLQQMGLGARDLREKAKVWLDKAHGGAEVSRILSELRNLKEDNELLRRQIAELNALYSDKDDQPKRGRPPRAA